MLSNAQQCSQILTNAQNCTGILPLSPKSTTTTRQLKKAYHFSPYLWKIQGSRGTPVELAGVPKKQYQGRQNLPFCISCEGSWLVFLTIIDQTWCCGKTKGLSCSILAMIYLSQKNDVHFSHQKNVIFTFTRTNCSYLSLKHEKFHFSLRAKIAN